MKGQMWSMDFIISFIMFFMAVVLVLFAWDYATTENYEQMLFNDMQSTGLIVSDVLVRTSGSPQDWNMTAMAIGLASEENTIDENKLRNFVFYMDYNDSRRIMGMGSYEYYFIMKNLDNQTMLIDGQPTVKGNYPPVYVKNIVPVERYVLYGGELAKLSFIVWL